MNPEQEISEPVEPEIQAQNIRTLESDILEFTTSLPFWEQYLSEKILAGSEITDEDYEKALQYFLEDVGLLEAEKNRPKINIVCRDHTGTYKADLQLSKILWVEGVNALVPGQVLEFGKNLTIVYGANGSGKSGYIRLLNNVFITKGEKTILPNIHNSAPIAKKAEFEFSTSTNSYTLNFPVDCMRKEFKQFSTFDEKAVHAHLNNRNQFEFRPAGLSYFSSINECCKKMDVLIQQKIDQHAQSFNLIALFDGESEIKTLISQLSDKTQIEHFTEYKDFTEEHKAERKRLEEAKAGLIGLKKDKEISDLAQIKIQLATLKTGLININRHFSSDQLTKTAAKIKDCIEKEKLATANNIDQFKKENIVAVGDAPWRNFILATDTFARLQDKPSATYPITDDLCLLCHQPLSDEAAKLISSYWTFIKSKAEQDSKEAQDTLATAKSAFEKLDFNLISEATTLYKWLFENKPNELVIFNKVLAEQTELRNKVITYIDNKNDEILTEAQSRCTCGAALTAGFSKGRNKYYLYYRCVHEPWKNYRGEKLHEMVDELLHNLSFSARQLRIIISKVKEKFDEQLKNRATVIKNKDKALAEVNKKINDLEEKLINGVIENSTYKKWFSKLSGERSLLQSDITKLKGDINQRWSKLEKALPYLCDMKNLYHKLGINAKQKLLKMWFKPTLIFDGEVLRTNLLHPSLMHNYLSIKEKRLLFVEQPSLSFAKNSISTPDGS